MLVINVKHGAVSFNEVTQTFCVELSSLQNRKIDDSCMRRAPIVAHNPETGNKITMTFVKADMDSSEEDTYGWHYTGFNSQNGRSFNFLFIND